MCGFAGVIAWDEKYRVTRDTLEKMSRAIAHRGPDGEGFHLTREYEPITPDTPQVGLAFRRLAILDPDPRSNQPFHIGPLTLVFNGEIYNFRDLKSEISNLRPDYHWRTTGDTEVLLMAYEVWREKCVEKLNGMFAFAVWDEQKKELFLARDRMGQKPLYVVSGAFGDSFPATDLRMDQYGSFDAVAFASESPALDGLRWVKRDIDPFALEGYLKLGCVNWSFNASVSCVDPGWSLTIRRGEMQERQYFAVRKFTPIVEDGDKPAATRKLVRQAVRRQLVSDVPLGVFLSGGIDSSIVAACARMEGPVRTFAVVFDDPRYDESAYAAQIAKSLGTEHVELRVSQGIADDLPRLAEVFGEPFGDSSAIPTHYLARETRNRVKVALSGDGGDELFGGYDRYRAMRLGKCLGALPTRPLRGLARLMSRGHPKSQLSRAGRLIASLDLDMGNRYESYVRLFDNAMLVELTLAPFPAHAGSLARLFLDSMEEGRDEVEAALAVDRLKYLPDDLLTKVDRCSMLHGLEVRSPFMDHELVQFAAGLTTDQLLKGGPKRMLREAFAKDLPDFVFKRKKMGFAVPIGEWFRGELKPMLRDNLFASDSFGKSHFNMKVVERLVDEHEQQRVDHSQRLYALLMLELWWQQQRR